MTIKERRNFLNLSDRQTNRQIDRQKNKQDKSVETRKSNKHSISVKQKTGKTDRWKKFRLKLVDQQMC
jgi:hypothetical protein